MRQRIGAALTWSVAQGLRFDNPADAVKAVLVRQSNGSAPQRSLPYSEVSGAIATVRGSNVALVLKLAFEFLVLTAARAGEIRFATWNEIDLEAAIWTVPAERMKAGRGHRVPLSPRAVETLTEARALRSKHGGLVFPSRGERPLTERGFVQALSRLGIDATAIPEWRGPMLRQIINIAVPAELKGVFGVESAQWLYDRSEDFARDYARKGCTHGSPASRLFDGGDFGLNVRSFSEGIRGRSAHIRRWLGVGAPRRTCKKLSRGLVSVTLK